MEKRPSTHSTTISYSTLHEGSSYEEMLTYLYAAPKDPKNPKDLNHLHLLDLHLGSPSRAFMSVHVAGTNGKGSVTTKIARALEAEGKKVGLFTSPHIHSYQERIQINGELISQESFQRHLWTLLQAEKALELKLSFFEYTTFIAFLWFAERGVDWAAIEAGLGGRLDATNCILPKLSVITSIGWDHMEYLGDTLEKIACEKSGIIKAKVPIVVGSQAASFLIFEKRAAELESPYRALQEESAHYEAHNTALARLALRELNLTEEAIQKGCQAIPECRFEVHQKKLPIIFDVAHNPDGFEALFVRIQYFYPQRTIRCILGFSYSKDALASLRVIKKYTSNIYVTQPAYKGMEIEVLENYLKEIEIRSLATNRDIYKICAHAYKEASREEILLICGSFYLMSAAKKGLEL